MRRMPVEAMPTEARLRAMLPRTCRETSIVKIGERTRGFDVQLRGEGQGGVSQEREKEKRRL